MKDLYERMKDAIQKTQLGGSDLGENAEACEAVAEEYAREKSSAEIRLSKREIFAAEALHGLLSNAAIGPYDDAKVTAYALSAVRCADALLRALGDA